MNLAVAQILPKEGGYAKKIPILCGSLVYPGYADSSFQECPRSYFCGIRVQHQFRRHKWAFYACPAARYATLGLTVQVDDLSSHGIKVDKGDRRLSIEPPAGLARVHD